MNQRNRKKRQDSTNLGRSPTFSYRAARSKQDASERKDRLSLADRENHIDVGASSKLKTLLYLRRVVFVLFIFMVIINLRVSTSPSIAYESSEQAINRTRDTYEQEINTIWEGNLLNRTKPTIQTKRIGSQIMKRFPEISGVYIDIPIVGSRPIVEVSFSEPEIILTAQANSFYVDAEGKTLAPIEDVEPAVLENITYVSDQSGLVPKSGSLALPSADALYILTVARLLNATDELQVETFVLPNEPNQVDVKLKGREYIVKLALDKSAEQGVGALIALQNKFKLDGTEPSVYIDLRVPDKAFYR